MENKKILLTVDIDSTIGKRYKIHPSLAYSELDFVNIVEMPEEDNYGDFYFYHGALNFLKELHDLSKRYPIHLAFFTASFDSPVDKRNGLLIEFIKEKLDCDYKLYDAKFLTYRKMDLVMAKGPNVADSLPPGWQSWFEELFTVYPIESLTHLEDEILFNGRFIKDHDTLIKLIGIEQQFSSIIHIDDDPLAMPRNYQERPNFHFFEFSKNDIEHAKKYRQIKDGILSILNKAL